MGFSFFGIFGKTNDFKIVDADKFAKFIQENDVTVLDVRTPA